VLEGQRLRWWQDQEEHSQPFQRVSERGYAAVSSSLSESTAAPVAETEAVSLAEEYSDTWEDLEAEAARRAEQAKREEAESVSFYLDKTSALPRHRRETRPLWWLMGIMVFGCLMVPLILQLASPGQHHSSPNIGGLSVLVILFVQYQRRQQWLQNQEKPTVRIAPQGLFIDTPMYKDVSLSWDEITEVKPRKRVLDIRASKRRRFIIEERDLPVSAEVLAARIAVYETGRQKA
jgi:hypothetical protein